MRFVLLLTAVLSFGASATPAQTPRTQAAVFAGGCFWCTESDFDKMPGVLSTTSGYIGGKLRNPTYEQVSAGGTGHIEAVRVVYDPAKISYATLASRFIGDPPVSARSGAEGIGRRHGGPDLANHSPGGSKARVMPARRRASRHSPSGLPLDFKIA